MNSSELAQQLNSRFKEMRQEKSIVNEKIKNWLEKIKNSNLSANDKAKKEKELIDLGVFLYKYDDTIKISDGNRESPDFLLENDNDNIGIELTDLIIDQFAKKTEGTIQKFFDKVQNHLNTLDKNYGGFYGVRFKRGIKLRNNSTPIVQEIIDIINSGKKETEFIEFIKKRPHSKIVLHNIQGGAFGKLEKQVVNSFIEKKEKNVAKYRNVSGVNTMWHLIVIGGSKNSDDYDYISDDVKTGVFESKFDKIFLFDFFRQDITELLLK